MVMVETIIYLGIGLIIAHIGRMNHVYTGNTGLLDDQQITSGQSDNYYTLNKIVVKVSQIIGRSWSELVIIGPK